MQFGIKRSLHLLHFLVNDMSREVPNTNIFLKFSFDFNTKQNDPRFEMKGSFLIIWSEIHALSISIKRSLHLLQFLANDMPREVHSINIFWSFRSTRIWKWMALDLRWRDLSWKSHRTCIYFHLLSKDPFISIILKRMICQQDRRPALLLKHISKQDGKRFIVVNWIYMLISCLNKEYLFLKTWSFNFSNT